MNLKNGLLLIVVILCLGIVRMEIVLRKMQDQRSVERFDSIVQTIQTSGETTATPSPTPPGHDTMHVTQRVGRNGLEELNRILQALLDKK